MDQAQRCGIEPNLMSCTGSGGPELGLAHLQFGTNLGKSQMENLHGSSGSPLGVSLAMALALCSFLLLNDSEGRAADTDPITSMALKFALCFSSAPAQAGSRETSSQTCPALH